MQRTIDVQAFRVPIGRRKAGAIAYALDEVHPHGCGGLGVQQHHPGLIEDYWPPDK
jgi:hypothetical protein